MTLEEEQLVASFWATPQGTKVLEIVENRLGHKNFAADIRRILIRARYRWNGGKRFD